MGRRRRRFDESKVVRWPAHSPQSKGGEFAPKHVPVPRWAVAVAERLPGGKTKTVTRRSAAGSRPASGPAREPDLFGDGERRFRAEPTRRAPRERYEQTQLLDTSGSRQRPGQESMLDELGNIDTSSGGAPAPAGTPGDADIARMEATVERLRGQLSQATEARKNRGSSKVASPREAKLRGQLFEARRTLSDAQTRRRLAAEQRGPAGTEQVNPKDITFGDTIILRRRDYTPEGPLGPERVEEHRVARVEVARHGPTGVSYVFYDADGHIIKGAAHNSKIEVRRPVASDTDQSTGTGPFAFPRGTEGWSMRYTAGLSTGMDSEKARRFADSGLPLDQFNALGLGTGGTTPDPTPDIARMDAYDSATRHLDQFAMSEKGRRYAMDRLGALGLGVSAKDVASVLRDGIGRSGHTKADDEALRQVADLLDRPRPTPPRVDVDEQPPGFVEPPHPDPSRDPQVLFDQAVDYAQALSDLRRPGDGAGYFRVLPALTALNGLKSGADPADVVRQLEAEAETHPEEWAGGREYLNRLAGFLRGQSTALPKAEAEANRKRRARFNEIAEGALGKDSWRLSTRHGTDSYGVARTSFELGRPSDDIVEALRRDADSLDRRANAGELQDYDTMGVLRHDPADLRDMGLADARRLRRLADALETAGQGERRGGAVPMTPADRKNLVARYANMSRDEFDALPEQQRAQILRELDEVATSGDKKRAFRDSMGSLVRGADADHVTRARSLRAELAAPRRPTREQEFDQLVARLKAGEGDIPAGLKRADLVRLDEALGLGESTSGRPTTDKLRQRMQAALGERRRMKGFHEQRERVAGELLDDTEGRTRQALIDEARPFGEFAAEMAELVGNQASRDVLKQRLSATAERLGIHHWVSPVISALYAGNRSGARSQLTRRLKRFGVELHGEPGSIVPLDRKRHEALSGGLPGDVSAVEVVRPGYTITLPGGEKVDVKARVVPHEVGPDFPHLQTVRNASTITALRVFARERGLTVPAYLKKKDEIRDWLENAVKMRPGEDPDAYAARLRPGATRREAPPAPTVRAAILKLKTNEERKAYLAGFDFRSQAEVNRLAKALGARQTRISIDATLDSIVKYFDVPRDEGTTRRAKPEGRTGVTRASLEHGDVVEWRPEGEDPLRGTVRREKHGKMEFVYIDWATGRSERVTGNTRKLADIHLIEGRTTRDHRAITRAMQRDTPAGIFDQVKDSTEEEADRLLRTLPPHRLALVAHKAGLRIRDTDTVEQLRAAIVREWAGTRRAGGVRPFVR